MLKVVATNSLDINNGVSGMTMIPEVYVIGICIAAFVILVIAILSHIITERCKSKCRLYSMEYDRAIAIDNTISTILAILMVILVIALFRHAILIEM